MKQVEFQRISIKNFLSVGQEPVVVDFRPGLHIITGINRDKEDRRNGVGKSTIADAIYFAIFGSTLRELKKENIVNHTTGKDCEVILDFNLTRDKRTKHFRLVRQLDPSKCFLYVYGEYKTRDSINNTTDYLLLQ